MDIDLNLHLAVLRGIIDSLVETCQRKESMHIMEKGLLQFAGTMDAVWKNDDVVRRYLAV